MSTQKPSAKLPKGLPKLPHLPKGYSQWEYKGMGYSSGSPVYYGCAKVGEPDWGNSKLLETTGAHPLYHYIVAVKAPLATKRAKTPTAAKSATVPAKTITQAQFKLLQMMEVGQWYGDYIDRSEKNVKRWPSGFDSRTFRQMLRKLKEAGAIESEMHKYDYQTSFIVRATKDTMASVTVDLPYGKKPATNAAKIERALAMVAESRPRMNELTRDQRKALEASGRASIASAKKAPAVTPAKELIRLRLAVRWALGEIGDFPARGPNDGAYWWRTELRQRASLGVIAKRKSK